jgi:hypothetical protein
MDLNDKQKPEPVLTPEMREQLKDELKAIEEAAYAKGLAAARGGHADPNLGLAAKLADRASELQKRALADGTILSNADAVKAAYREAGVPLQ